MLTLKQLEDQQKEKNKAAADAIKAKAEADAALKESTKPADFNNPPAGKNYQWHVFAGGGGEWRLINAAGFGGSITSNATSTLSTSSSTSTST